MRTIMMIEDEPDIREELAALLTREGYRAVAVTDFTDIPGQVKSEKPDLILMDILLPGVNGLTLCTQLRKTIQTPIIFVTSRDTAMDELRGLSLGGDDYITKPYDVLLLLARIRAVLRRSDGAPAADTIEACGLKLQLAKGVVKPVRDVAATHEARRAVAEQPVRGAVSAPERSAELSRNELQILAHLMRHAGDIVSRADLIDVLWDHQIYIDDNTLSVNVTRLRSKLAALGRSDCIKTRRGLGYQLCADGVPAGEESRSEGTP